MSSANDPIQPQEGETPVSEENSFASVMTRRLNRRTLLRGAAAASAVAVTASVASKAEAVKAATAPAPVAGFQAGSLRPVLQTGSDISFLSVTNDAPMVPPGYTVDVLLRWGDPVVEGAPAFNPNQLTASAQAQQFGYNCDFIGFMPMPEYGSGASDRGLLVVNHEYTNPELMFAGYDLEAPEPTKAQVDVELEAHGLSVVEIQKNEQGKWTVVADSPLNRRLTGTSPMTITGPAAGNDLLKTSADKTGTEVFGTLNNCSGGKTPWGTVLTAEENFHQYFANQDLMEDGDVKDVHGRYVFPKEATERLWENFYDRFDLTKEPNESFRFGWMVEFDPYDPESVPMKRTALGRFKHEAATVVPPTAGKPVVIYSGDDERFEYVYKFVSSGNYEPDDREANMQLLDEGTLYVAKFNDDGTGEWLPLTFGEGPLTAANGFKNQGEVLIKTRLAADLLGATTMDRPEDIETNPVNNKVYMVMTKNDRRLEEGSAEAAEKPVTQEVNAANPRPVNQDGHIIEVTETNDDHASTTFTWEIFLLCGHPSDETTFFGGFDKAVVSPISSPDNIVFDLDGNLWIATDGQPSALGVNDGFFLCPVDGPKRGQVTQFFSSVPGSEVCGPEFTPDNTTLFLAIQHPGEGGSFDRPMSYWPDYKVPTRPSVVVVQAEDPTKRIGLV
ncbi:MAG TPA: PhoX family phosphatase [Anaerolineae bacterium]|nr:PhoX family phosphatase [Anaerolineae bacterium]HMR62838.1 PhoX family phosphatase [Anaerolineae bacterium]